MFLISDALAADAAAGGASAALMQFLPLILIIVVFWLFLIRPQQKRAKLHKQMLAELKKGDYVMTSAGFLGRIIEITDETVLLECGTAQLKMSRAAIGSVTDKDGKALQAAPKK